MDKADAISAVIDATPDTPVIFSTGYACRIANSIADRPNYFYMTGSMGLAANIGTGIAAAPSSLTAMAASR
jgi:sulfopyruvate decarboxylase subunit beta